MEWPKNGLPGLCDAHFSTKLSTGSDFSDIFRGLPACLPRRADPR
jgi:hypothetical protein